jgi:uroporphyrinogen decarboxylase
MDPMVLYSSPDTIRKEVALILKNYGSGSGHIFNLGHGITPNVDPEHAAVFIDAVHKLSKPYHE